MKIKIESKKGLQTNLSITVDKNSIEEKMNKRFEELSKTVNLKGFRPGKVPLSVLKTQFGKNVFAEILDKILNESSEKAIKENKLKVATQPKIELKTYGEGKDLIYNLQVEELPSISITPLENFKVTDYEINVSEKETEKRLEEIAKNQNNFADKNENDLSENGDLVVFDYTATIDNKSFEGNEGKNTQLILGKDLFIKGFDKQLIGIKKGQEKNIDVVMPPNYPKKELVGKKSIFKCKIINVKKPTKVNMDDKFAQQLGAKDLKDLRLLITNQIKAQFKSNMDLITKKEILDQLEKFKNVEIPNTLIEREISFITKDQKKEDLEKNKNDIKDSATKRVKIGLILNEIGEKNNLKVTDDEIYKEINNQAKSMPEQSNQLLEYYKKNPSAAEGLRGNIYENKILDFIKSKCKITKRKISTKDAEKIIIEQNKINEKVGTKNKVEQKTVTKKIKSKKITSKNPAKSAKKIKKNRKK
ncbi:MAG: trigger factor [Candidatus Pelagibacter sp. TMED64]|nr:trigger factor [Candidatus Pelagibacter sp.]OUU67573.1 MAG: trigger factor [Candidatus Pelagibacter sp. TMED64]